MAGLIKAVVFDLDDTLYDCTGSLLEASRRRAARVLVEAGLPMSPEEALRMQVALGEERGPHFKVFDEIARQYDLGEEVIASAYRAYNSDEVGEIHLFSDASSTLKFLRDEGILCFLLTSGIHRRQAVKIHKLGLEDAFDEVVINDVERGQLISDCLRHLLGEYDLRPGETLLVGDRPPQEIHAGNDLGMLTVQMLHGRFSAFEPRDASEKADFRISHLYQIPTLVRLINMNKPPESLRIVAIGGGTGLPIVLEGCKTYCHAPTGIVTVTDSGRSSGRLRDELGILPPGDARNCLIALSKPGRNERLLNHLFQYRFDRGSFEGMSLGNLIIAAMSDLEGSFRGGIDVLSQLLSIRGKVLPPTSVNCHICAELQDGSLREGEVSVRGTDKPRIKRVYLKPESPPACEEAVSEILKADIVVIGPGSLFTSVLANLLVPGIRDALAETDAVKIYICNIVTQPGQTDGLDATAHLATILEYISPKALDYAMFNNYFPGDAVMERYRAEGAQLVVADERTRRMGVKIAEGSLVEDLDQKRVLWEKQDLLRHNPDRLADAVCRIFAGLPTDQS